MTRPFPPAHPADPQPDRPRRPGPLKPWRTVAVLLALLMAGCQNTPPPRNEMQTSATPDADAPAGRLLLRLDAADLEEHDSLSASPVAAGFERRWAGAGLVPEGGADDHALQVRLSIRETSGKTATQRVIHEGVTELAPDAVTAIGVEASAEPMAGPPRLIVLRRPSVTLTLAAAEVGVGDAPSARSREGVARISWEADFLDAMDTLNPGARTTDALWLALRGVTADGIRAFADAGTPLQPADVVRFHRAGLGAQRLHDFRDLDLRLSAAEHLSLHAAGLDAATAADYLARGVPADAATLERYHGNVLKARQAEAQRVEAERVEARRLEAERAEARRLEMERLHAKLEDEKRLARERAVAEAHAQAQAERMEADRVEAERLAAEQAEAQRIEMERVAAEREEEARLAREKAEAEAQAQIVAQRMEAERVEAERLAAAQAEAQRLEAQRLAAEQAASDAQTQTQAQAQTQAATASDPSAQGATQTPEAPADATTTALADEPAPVTSAPTFYETIIAELDDPQLREPTTVLATEPEAAVTSEPDARADVTPTFNNETTKAVAQPPVVAVEVPAQDSMPEMNEPAPTFYETIVAELNDPEIGAADAPVAADASVSPEPSDVAADAEPAPTPGAPAVATAATVEDREPVVEATPLPPASPAPAGYAELLARLGITEPGHAAALYEARVPPRLIHGFRAAGHEASVIDLLDAHRLGLDPAAAQTLADAGYGFTVADLARLHAAGVDPRYAAALHDDRFKALTADQLVRLWNDRVTVAAVKNKRQLALDTPRDK